MQYSVLNGGDSIATTFMPRLKGMTNQDAINISKSIETYLSHSGFKIIKSRTQGVWRYACSTRTSEKINPITVK